MEQCADTLIGDETQGMKGISGGQKRRVSLGIELIKDPSIIFLDEPTSGLDSEMALGVITALVNLARRNRTVVCTIHQVWGCCARCRCCRCCFPGSAVPGFGGCFRPWVPPPVAALCWGEHIHMVSLLLPYRPRPLMSSAATVTHCLGRRYLQLAAALSTVQAMLLLAPPSSHTFPPSLLLCPILSFWPQPNSDITALFDDLLLLAKGRVAYAGPWSGALPAFASAGFECPLYKNPTDYFMSVLHHSESADIMCNMFAASKAGTGEKWAAQRPASPALLPLPAVAASLTHPSEDGLQTTTTAADGHQPPQHVALEVAGGAIKSPPRSSSSSSSEGSPQGGNTLGRHYTSMTSMGMGAPDKGPQGAAWGTQVGGCVAGSLWPMLVLLPAAAAA